MNDNSVTVLLPYCHSAIQTQTQTSFAGSNDVTVSLFSYGGLGRECKRGNFEQLTVGQSGACVNVM